MITVEHLTKYYGDHLAVDDLSFSIKEGHVYGFLGPNGAGKSTTMNIITGCLSPSSGTVKIDGADIFEEPGKAKKLLGYLPELPPLYLNESPYEYLKFVGRAKGVKGSELEDQIQKVCEMTGITGVSRRKIANLSKGYKQRVGIAQALLGSPKVIILDEPTVGLDPRQIIEIRDLITELGKNHTVILSSHILSEVQAICDEILIISKGKLLAFDKPENLEKALLTPNRIKIVTDMSKDDAEKLISSVNEISETVIKETGEITEIIISADCENIYDISGNLYKAFARTEKIIYELNVSKATLEDIFIELTENENIAEITDDLPEDIISDKKEED